MEIRDLSKIDVATILKNKNLLANLGIVVIALIFTRNMHLSQLNKIGALREQISQEEEITSFVEELKTLENKIERFEKDFYVNLSSDIVIDTVSSMARKHDIRISSIDPEAIIDKKIYRQLPIKLNIEASYHNLGHFISELENTGMLEVKDLEIKSKETFSSEGHIENSVVLKIIAVSIKKED